MFYGVVRLLKVFRTIFTLVFLFSLISCQTLKILSTPFFEGSVQIKENNKRESFKVEIYKHFRKKALRIDILAHWNQLFLTYLWNEKEYLLLFPYHKRYYKSKKPPFQSPSSWSALINNPLLLLQILNQNMDSTWVCEQAPIKKCHFKDMKVQWNKKHILFERQKINQEFTLRLTQKSIPIKIVEKLFTVQIPQSFQKVNKLSLQIK